MKAVILAGGLGTRISEESHLRPKPMVEIGGQPVLWHILKFFSQYKVTDFIICLGYKGYVIKEYFANYVLHNADLTVDLASGDLTFHARHAEPWRITLVDTGADTMTGGRLKRVSPYLDAGKPFFFTYGDGLADVDLKALLDFHQEHGRLASVTSVSPPGRYGTLDLEGAQVRRFIEKPPGDAGRINGGYFVLEPGVIDLIAGDETVFEVEPLEQLAEAGELMAYRHNGFWAAMDTVRDRNQLEALWVSGTAPWRIWP